MNKQDITEMEIEGDKLKNTVSRRKNATLEEVNNNLKTFKEDIKQMLIDWKTDITETLFSDIKLIKQNIGELRQYNKDIGKTTEFLHEEQVDLKKKIITLEKDKENLTKTVEEISMQLNNLQTKMRSNCLEIRNIPRSENENLKKLFFSISCVLNSGITEDAVREIHRQPGKHDHLKPIIVEFNNSLTKDILIKSFKSYNANNKGNRLNTNTIGMPGSRSPIFISEHYSDKVKKMFFLARELKKAQNYKFCWISNGRVFIRKSEGEPHILLRSENHIRELHSCTI